MKCDFCDNEANVFFVQVIDGESKKKNLCEACAEQQGVTSLDEFKITDILMSDESPKQVPDTTPTVDMSECSHCGFTAADLRKVGRLGCSHCYQQFGSEVVTMLKDMHKGTEHKGKMPVGMMAAMRQKRELEKLEAALAEAIADENYEKAAELNAQLKDLKNKPSKAKRRSQKGGAK